MFHVLKLGCGCPMHLIPKAPEQALLKENKKTIRLCSIDTENQPSILFTLKITNITINISTLLFAYLRSKTHV